MPGRCAMISASLRPKACGRENDMPAAACNGHHIFDVSFLPGCGGEMGRGSRRAGLRPVGAAFFLASALIVARL